MLILIIVKLFTGTKPKILEMYSSNSISSSQLLLLPNLPGFKPREQKSAMKKKYFQKVDGVSFYKDEFPQLGSFIEEGSLASIGSASIMSKTRPTTSIENTKMVLSFQAYFEEELADGAELKRVRRCNINYFLEDGTMQIVERPQINSGLAQGTLVKRAICYDTYGNPYTINELRLGDELVIFSRKYRLVDCDAATRKYLKRIQNVAEAPGLDIPIDAFEEEKRKGTGTQLMTWDQFRSKKNANKAFAEAMCGNTVNNASRAGFIAYGNKKLKFLCIWDNTEMLYGDLVEFCMAYSLADDCVEIFALPTYNSGRDEFSRLLSKSKLPKSPTSNLLDGGNPNEPIFYHWSDFYIGMELPVYGRTIKVSSELVLS